MTDPDPPEHVKRNRDLWDRWAEDYAQVGARAWAGAEPSWRIWSVPESDLHVLPADLSGRDAIELGCGTAYMSCWLARRGARVVAIDNSEAQLATARRYQQEHALYFPLLHGDAEQVPYPEALVGCGLCTGNPTLFMASRLASPRSTSRWGPSCTSEAVARADCAGPRGG